MANAKDYVENRDVLKEDFGWEVPVELVPLPSKGVIYDPETPLYKKEAVKIRAMTARDEDILASAALIKEGTVLDHLITSCLKEKGVNSHELVIGDRNALMVAIRVTGYGTDYPVGVNCNSCGKHNDVNINLGELEIKRLGVEPAEIGKNLFEYTLPVTKKKVKFKFITMKDEKENSIRAKSLKKNMSDKAGTAVTDSLEMAICEIDGITDKNKIRHFILNMPAYDSRSLRKFIKDNEPGMNMTWQYDCSACDRENNIAIPITSEFFWPST